MSTVPGLLSLVLLLLTLRLQELVEACSCAPAHPQQAFCNSEIVIRAKIAGEKMVSPSNSSLSHFKMIQYEIKLVKMFKGFEKFKDIQYVYTPPYSSLCGVKLEANNKAQYLLSGRVWEDGRVMIGLCDFIEPWDNLSMSQRRASITDMKWAVTAECYTLPCSTTAENECLWTDWLTDKSLNGHQAKHFACIKRTDGSCSWYRGSSPRRKSSWTFQTLKPNQLSREETQR